jgi:hypothetical protein
MPNNTRIPAAAAGGNTGEFFPVEGNVSVMLPAEDHSGVFGCTDATAAISYGILALKSLYGYSLDSIQIWRNHSIRPEWWKTALIYCAQRHMAYQGVPCPVLENKDNMPNPNAVGLPAWARWHILSGAGRNVPDTMTSKAVVIGGFLGSLDLEEPSSVITVFKAIQDLFDEPDKEPEYVPQSTGASEAKPQPDLFKFLHSREPSLNDKTPWGELMFSYPPLSVGIRSAMNALRPKPGFCGAFRYPQRAILPVMDGRAFGQRQRCLGGTVLLDGSGSMGLSGKDIEAMIDQRPALTVAMYQGSGTKGMLYVLARNGKRVKEIPHYGCSNVVDGPALKWLGKQRRPRVWVSDGGVTGERDKVAFPLTMDAELIRRRHGIRQFESIKHYLKASSIR